VSPYGFGRALYINHPNGYTSVYAHLKNFSPQIEAYVKEQQYAKEQNEVDLFPVASAFTFTKGAVIANAGNSGGSGGPHLHFELRNTRSEKIINPLLFGYKIDDTRAPSLASLVVYEFAEDDLVSSESLEILDQGDGQYALAGNATLEVTQLPAFGLQTFDRQDDAWNKNGVYRIELYLNEELCYDFKMETFAFAESRYINSHIDFGLKDCCRKTVNKLYLDPYNELSVYAGTPKINLPQLAIDSTAQVRIRVSDVAQNTSELTFAVKRVKALNELPQEPVSLPLFFAGQSNSFKSEQLEVTLPAKALYRDVFFEHQKSEACPSCLSDVQQVGSSAIPVHQYYQLKLKPSKLIASIPTSKYCIISLKDGAVADYEGGTYSGGWVSARTRQFGDFAVSFDTLAPTIAPINFKNGSTLSGTLSQLKIKIDDDLSGIEKYNAYINDEWLRLYFDAKTRTLTISNEDLPTAAGNYTLKLVVEDDKQNQNTETYKIIRP
jgi:hypothetical protein